MTQEDRKDAAVSETLGYILLFAIVTLSIAVIYAIGYPALQTNMESNIFESAEQSFIVLQSNIDKVAFDQVPVKVLKIKLQRSSVSVSNESSMTINYDGNPPLFVPTGEIVFEKSDKTLTYEMGGVFKAYPPDSNVMVSKPPIYVTADDDVTVTTIGLISLKGRGYASGKGITTISLHHDSSTMNMSPSITNVTVQINSKHASKWTEYLENTGFTITNTTSSTVSAQKNNTMLILSIHEVDVDIS
jgi:hypothetical protein